MPEPKIDEAPAMNPPSWREIAEAQGAELERWRSGQRVKGLRQVESVPDGLQYAAALVRAQGTEGGEEHDALLAEAGLRLRDLADAARQLLAEAVALRTENAGLREALEASEAECATVIEERDRLRMQRDQVWQAIDQWADDPDTNVDQLLDVWASHEKALADRDAMRAVVDRVLARHAQLGTLCEADRFDLARSYTQSSNPPAKIDPMGLVAHFDVDKGGWQLSSNPGEKS